MSSTAITMVLVFIFGALVGAIAAMFAVRRHLLRGGSVRGYDGTLRYVIEGETKEQP